MNLIRLLLRTSRGVVALSILAGLGSGLSGVGLIMVIHAELGRNSPSGWVLGASCAALCVAAAATRIVAQAALVRVAQGSVTHLSVQLCRRILALPLRQFEEIDPASLLAVLTDDIVVLSNALVGIPLLCINVPIVVACLGFVGWLSPLVLACAIGIAVPAVLGYDALASLGMRRLAQAREGQDALVGHFRDLIAGVRELKLHRPRHDAFLDDRLQSAAVTVRDHNTAGMTLFSLAASWSQLAFFGFIGFVLFVLPEVGGVSRAAVSGAVLVTLYLMSPLDVIVTWIPILGRARVSMNKIEQLGLSLEARGAEEAKPIAPSIDRFHSVELMDATYTYVHGEGRLDFALGPIDLTLRPEEIVFVVGGNGSGKTTLVKLITGLYSPESGSVLLDGQAVTSNRIEDYRQLFSVVFTDGHLFNALIGLDRLALDEQAKEALTRLELTGEVNVAAGVFSTTDLSQGQKKRLALLTLLLEDRPICVLDEWASNQDPRFKQVFYLEILPELRAKGKSLLVISHDEDYFHVADRVVRLDHGRLTDGEDPVIPEPRLNAEVRS
jgi:putative ATP-binding cassette transporter